MKDKLSTLREDGPDDAFHASVGQPGSKAVADRNFRNARRRAAVLGGRQAVTAGQHGQRTQSLERGRKAGKPLAGVAHSAVHGLVQAFLEKIDRLPPAFNQTLRPGQRRMTFETTQPIFAKLEAAAQGVVQSDLKLPQTPS